MRRQEKEVTSSSAFKILIQLEALILNTISFAKLKLEPNFVLLLESALEWQDRDFLFFLPCFIFIHSAF